MREPEKTFGRIRTELLRPFPRLSEQCRPPPPKSLKKTVFSSESRRAFFGVRQPALKKPRYKPGFLQKRGMTAKFFTVTAILITPISQQEIIA